MNDSNARKLLDFIAETPTCFHAVKNLSEMLKACGFKQLNENEKWKLSAGGKYFVTRNGSSVISFCIPEGEWKGFSIAASHGDSPCFKLKDGGSVQSSSPVRLNVEKYGGAVLNSWFDRPLGLAGRVIAVSSENGEVKTREITVDFEKDLFVIPSLAPHLKKDSDSKSSPDIQMEMLPFAGYDTEFDVISLLAEKTGVKPEEIGSFDLFLYNRDSGRFWGQNDEFIVSPRLDDLECVFGTFEGFISACESEWKNENILVHCVFDNEEVGSRTRQGADSTFLQDVLKRICLCENVDEEGYYIRLSKSFLVSADNAHAFHPGYASSYDINNRPQVNAGPVIKYNAAQKYTTAGISASVFKKICQDSGVPFQVFTNNSGIAGGSTLGNISAAKVPVVSVDIGLAQWAMHSSNESAGARDIDYLIKAMKEFYSSSVKI